MRYREFMVPCLVTVLISSTVAIAAPPPVTLTVNISGNGVVDPPGGTFARREVVSLAAMAAPGWYFDRWEGDLSGSDNPASITMQGSKTVTAVFLEGVPAFTVPMAIISSSATRSSVATISPVSNDDDGVPVRIIPFSEITLPKRVFI